MEGSVSGLACRLGPVADGAVWAGRACLAAALCLCQVLAVVGGDWVFLPCVVGARFRVWGLGFGASLPGVLEVFPGVVGFVPGGAALAPVHRLNWDGLG